MLNELAVKERDNKPKGLITKISGFQKLLMCVAFSVFVYLVLSIYLHEKYTVVILIWDAFALSMIVLNWILFISTSHHDLCQLVKKQDDGLKVIFLIVILATSFSVFGTLILFNAKIGTYLDRIYHMLITLSPVLLSWILLHTIFTVRYAHLYHDHNELQTGSRIGGLVFPSTEPPDYIDFAYFSFVVGMTFQVSDVVVSSRVIRRFVLMHGLISFAFNTIIVALTINAIAGLKI